MFDGFCVRIKYPDGRMGSYWTDPIGIILLFLIRRTNFQQGNPPSVGCRAKFCGVEVKDRIKRGNFEIMRLI
jgi:hypothetical protein